MISSSFLQASTAPKTSVESFMHGVFEVANLLIGTAAVGLGLSCLLKRFVADQTAHALLKTPCRLFPSSISVILSGGLAVASAKGDDG
jgi:hypothetical protein